MHRKHLGVEHERTLFAIFNLGMVLAQVGEAEEARALVDEAVHAAQTALGADHPRTIQFSEALAKLDQSQGQQDAAGDGVGGLPPSQQHQQGSGLQSPLQVAEHPRKLDSDAAPEAPSAVGAPALAVAPAAMPCA